MLSLSGSVAFWLHGGKAGSHGVNLAKMGAKNPLHLSATRLGCSSGGEKFWGARGSSRTLPVFHGFAMLCP